MIALTAAYGAFASTVADPTFLLVIGRRIDKTSCQLPKQRVSACDHYSKAVNYVRGRRHVKLSTEFIE